jgi:eukaryotic-like serine/threonine-protein kinase
LKKISVRGGAPMTLCAAMWVYGAIWYPDNTILFADIPKGIMRVSANGGSPETLIKGPAAAPQILQDGKALLYTDVAKQPYRIVVQSLKSAERKELFAGIAAHYLPTGHLIYGLPNNINLFAVPFDVRILEVKGGPVPTVEGVNNMFAVSDLGTLVYLPGVRPGSASGNTLVWVDREGKEEALHTPSENYKWPKISPDGKRVALTKSPSGNDQQIWIWDLVRETMTRLTLDKYVNFRPIWTQDSKRIVFISNRDGKFGIYWKAADGTDEVQRLGLAPDLNLVPCSWSSDGKTLALEAMNSDFTHLDIATLSMDGDHAIKLLLRADYTEGQPTISPDGKYMAYMSNESGQMEVYVRPFPEVNKGKWPISTEGGESPLWSPDGRELFYRQGNAVMAVAMDTKSTFNAGKPRILFQGAYASGYSESPAWDISPEGKRFLMIKKSPSMSTAAVPASPRRITVILNWFEELKQRVPVK